MKKTLATTSEVDSTLAGNQIYFCARRSAIQGMWSYFTAAGDDARKRQVVRAVLRPKSRRSNPSDAIDGIAGAVLQQMFESKALWYDARM